MWVSVLGLSKINPFDSFPYIGINADNGENVTVENESTLHEVFNSWTDHFYEFSLLLCHPSTFLDSVLQDLIKRYQYCKTFNVPPFLGGYDDQPEYWLDACTIIEREITNATNYRAKNGK